ncbi:MAG: hypothetical protein KDB21_10890 [Acidimicrobiales bacterium]|nr:hypothetical protein [Acidimicrobiales bacterium]
MAAPEYVPIPPLERTRYYTSPPRRADSWMPERPGELDEPGQPSGAGLGNQGPDQGFALRLARRFADRVVLQRGEHLADVLAGGVSVALKRASLFSRAPVIHDLTAAFTVWGFLSDSPPPALVELRRELFEEVSNPHHYAELRRIPAMVPEKTLRFSLDELPRRHDADWKSLLDLSHLPGTVPS